MENDKKLQSGGFGTTSLVLALVGLIILPPILGPLAIMFGIAGLIMKQKYSDWGIIIGIIDIGIFLYLFSEILEELSKIFS